MLEASREIKAVQEIGVRSLGMPSSVCPSAFLEIVR
jgi:hypothetical protein